MVCGTTSDRSYAPLLFELSNRWVAAPWIRTPLMSSRRSSHVCSPVLPQVCLQHTQTRVRRPMFCRCLGPILTTDRYVRGMVQASICMLLWIMSNVLATAATTAAAVTTALTLEPPTLKRGALSATEMTRKAMNTGFHTLTTKTPVASRPSPLPHTSPNVCLHKGPLRLRPCSAVIVTWMPCYAQLCGDRLADG